VDNLEELSECDATYEKFEAIWCGKSNSESTFSFWLDRFSTGELISTNTKKRRAIFFFLECKYVMNLVPHMLLVSSCAFCVLFYNNSFNSNNYWLGLKDEFTKVLRKLSMSKNNVKKQCQKTMSKKQSKEDTVQLFRVFYDSKDWSESYVIIKLENINQCAIFYCYTVFLCFSFSAMSTPSLLHS
jgi:hypothetical protein